MLIVAFIFQLDALVTALVLKTFFSFGYSGSYSNRSARKCPPWLHLWYSSRRILFTGFERLSLYFPQQQNIRWLHTGHNHGKWYASSVHHLWYLPGLKVDEEFSRQWHYRYSCTRQYQDVCRSTNSILVNFIYNHLADSQIRNQASWSIRNNGILHPAATIGVLNLLSGLNTGIFYFIVVLGK